MRDSRILANSVTERSYSKFSRAYRKLMMTDEELIMQNTADVNFVKKIEKITFANSPLEGLAHVFHNRTDISNVTVDVEIIVPIAGLVYKVRIREDLLKGFAWNKQIDGHLVNRLLYNPKDPNDPKGIKDHRRKIVYTDTPYVAPVVKSRSLMGLLDSDENKTPETAQFMHIIQQLKARNFKNFRKRAQMRETYLLEVRTVQIEKQYVNMTYFWVPFKKQIKIVVEQLDLLSKHREIIIKFSELNDVSDLRGLINDLSIKKNDFPGRFRPYVDFLAHYIKFKRPQPNVVAEQEDQFMGTNLFNLKRVTMGKSRLSTQEDGRASLFSDHTLRERSSQLYIPLEQDDDNDQVEPPILEKEGEGNVQPTPCFAEKEEEELRELEIWIDTNVLDLVYMNDIVVLTALKDLSSRILEAIAQENGNETARALVGKERFAEVGAIQEQIRIKHRELMASKQVQANLSPIKLKKHKSDSSSSDEEQVEVRKGKKKKGSMAQKAPINLNSAEVKKAAEVIQRRVKMYFARMKFMLKKMTKNKKDKVVQRVYRIIDSQVWQITVLLRKTDEREIYNFVAIRKEDKISAWNDITQGLKLNKQDTKLANQKEADNNAPTNPKRATGVFDSEDGVLINTHGKDLVAYLLERVLIEGNEVKFNLNFESKKHLGNISSFLVYNISLVKIPDIKITSEAGSAQISPMEGRTPGQTKRLTSQRQNRAAMDSLSPEKAVDIIPSNLFLYIHTTQCRE